jgi:hypothetical protein
MTIVMNRLNSTEQSLELKLRVYMQQDLINKIIQWKRDNPTHDDNFERFLYELFPENIKTEDNVEFKTEAAKRRLARRTSSFSSKEVVWVDKRVNNKEWKEMFSEVKASDEITPLGLPPGVEEQDDTTEAEFSQLGEMGFWDKTKLAWELGIAEVGNLDISSIANAGTLSLGGFKIPTEWPYSIALSPISSCDSDSDAEASPTNSAISASTSSSNRSSSLLDDGDDGESESTRELVIAFYKRHNPEKLRKENVDRILSKYSGREQEQTLVRQWESKYGVDIRKEAWYQQLRGGCGKLIHSPQSNQA